MSTYIEKNRGFITSSKLKLFETCQWCYEKKYIQEIPDPYEEYEDKDPLVIGQAIDDLITHGKDNWKEKYEIVKRRNGDGLKIQLTESMKQNIDYMEKEYYANGMFPKTLKKHVIEHEFSGLKLRSELDNINHVDKMIEDLKSCANITTFRGDAYLVQMSFYQFMIEEQTGERYGARLFVVDKNKPISRSAYYEYSIPTLLAERGRILSILENMKNAHETGVFLPAKDQFTLYNCPYYGLENHGRPNEPIIF